MRALFLILFVVDADAVRVLILFVVDADAVRVLILFVVDADAVRVLGAALCVNVALLCGLLFFFSFLC